MTEKKPFPLLLCAVSILSGILSLGFLLLWALNLEVAIRLFCDGLDLLSTVLPGAFYRFGVGCAADLSTISTLVPLLVFAFPAWQGFRALRHYRRTEDVELRWRPYPPHFAFFLIMLGLAGTLYGLMIGLQSSGVEAVAKSGLSSDAVQDSVQRLLSGTATAVLSSLVGLLGAFFAARPIAWIFCRSLPLVIAEELPEDLEDTVDRLCEGLGRMDRTVREVTRSMTPIPFEQITKQLDAIHAQHGELTQGMRQMCAALDRCAEGLSKADGLEKKVEGITAGVTALRNEQDARGQALATGVAALGERIERAGQEQSDAQLATGGRVEAAIREQGAGQAAVVDAVRELGETTRAGDRQRREERSVFRKAFAAFLQEESDNG
ncbi:MAG: hypothetical protein HN341_13600 [Verrucomicrobia bacterium]|jgi:hypothetical protein|nr:hypothetical protein [Verrucomicrobiota bacterium]